MGEGWAGSLRLEYAAFLPGESPWTEKPGGLQSMGSQRIGHKCATKCIHTHMQAITYGMDKHQGVTV